MENYFLLYVFISALIGIFGLCDLGIYVYEKYFCVHFNTSYWSAYRSN